MADSSLGIAIKADTTDLNTKVALTKAALAQTTAELNKAGKAAVQTGADLGTMLPVITKLTQQQTQMQASLRSLTGEHGKHAAAVGSNRMAYMEFGHVTRSAFDSLAAGASPMRVIEVEGARVVQAFTEMSAAAQATVIRMAAIAGPVAAVAAGLGVLAYNAIEAKTALDDLDNSTAAVGRGAEVTSGVTNRMASDVKQRFALSDEAADQLVATINTIPEASLKARDALIGLAPAIAAASKQPLDVVAKDLSGGFKDTSALEGFVEKNRLVVPALQASGKAADSTTQLYQAQGAVLDALQQRYGKFGDQQSKFAQGTTIAAVLAQSQLNQAALLRGQAPTALPEAPKLADTSSQGLSEAQERAEGLIRTTAAYESEQAKITKAMQDQAQIGAELKATTGLTANEVAVLKDRYAGAAAEIARLKDKGEHASPMQALEAPLTEQLLAAKTSAAGRLVIEQGYWTKQLALAKAGGATQVEVAHEIETKLLGIQDQQQAASLTAVTRDNSRMVAAARALAEDQAGVARSNASAKLAVNRSDLQAAKDSLQQQVDDGKITTGQKIDQEEALARQIEELDEQALTAEIDLRHASLTQVADYNNQILKMRHDLNRDLGALDLSKAAEEERTRQHELQRVKQQDKEIANSAASSLVGMLDGRQSFTQAAIQMGERLVQRAIAWGLEEVLNAVRIEATKTAAVAAGGASQIAVKTTTAAAGKAVDAAAGSASVLGDANKAAAGAYSAVAGIPIIGPVLAPVAAAAAFVAVGAFDVFSSEGGLAQVPYDDTPAILHRNETVLPADLAQRFRDAAPGGGGGNFSPTVHVYGAGKNGPSTADIIRELRNAHRNGVFAS